MVHGDTPVVVTVNGQEYFLDSIEEAKDVVSADALASVEKGESIVLNITSVPLILTADGAGAFIDQDGYEWSVEHVGRVFENAWCRDCGKRVGDGTNGTCVYFTRDKECPLCGHECKKLACHTCDE